jgi:hypothetical protein
MGLRTPSAIAPLFYACIGACIGASIGAATASVAASSQSVAVVSSPPERINDLALAGWTWPWRQWDFAFLACSRSAPDIKDIIMRFWLLQDHYRAA